MSFYFKYSKNRVKKPNEWPADGSFAIIVFKISSYTDYSTEGYGTMGGPQHVWNDATKYTSEDYEIYVFNDESTWKLAIGSVMEDDSKKGNFLALRGVLPVKVRTRYEVEVD